MAEKLIIIMANTDPRNGEELGAPIFQATVAAAMDYEVDVICTATAGRLMAQQGLDRLGRHLDVGDRFVAQMLGIDQGCELYLQASDDVQTGSVLNYMPGSFFINANNGDYKAWVGWLNLTYRFAL